MSVWRFIAVLLFCHTAQSGEIRLKYPEQINCGDTVTLTWELKDAEDEARLQMTPGTQYQLSLYRADKISFFNERLEILGKFTYPTNSFDWVVPAEPSKEWLDRFKGRYRGYFRIKTINNDIEFNNNPGFPNSLPRFDLFNCIHVDCVVSEWAFLEECEPSCGPTARRRRSRRIETQSEGNGMPCPTAAELVEPWMPCDVPECQGPSVDCKLSEWSAWTQCIQCNGSGTRSRQRTIETPSENGGASCDENRVEEENCTEDTVDKNLCPNVCRTTEPRCDGILKCKQVQSVSICVAPDLLDETPGTELSACILGQMCNPGLVCNEDVCVKALVQCQPGTKGCTCENSFCETGTLCTFGVCEPQQVIRADANQGDGIIFTTPVIVAIAVSAFICCLIIVVGFLVFTYYLFRGKKSDIKLSERNPYTAATGGSSSASFKSAIY